MNKKLERSSNKKILGVAGGLANYFDFDPTLVRLALLAMMLFDGSGTILITYLIAGLLMPKAGASAEKFSSEDIRVEEAHEWPTAAG
ncbi:MAG: PspC domain-containing protein [Candidatus Promineifilaceae bacterium]